MNIKRSLPALEEYFKAETNTPELINHYIKNAALRIASFCNHPADLTTQDLEDIAMPLQYLSEIVEIIDRYEDEEQRDDNDKA